MASLCGWLKWLRHQRFNYSNLTIALERRCSSLNGAIKASWPAEMALTLTI